MVQIILARHRQSDRREVVTHVLGTNCYPSPGRTGKNGAQRRNGQNAEKRQQNQWRGWPICESCVAPVWCKVETAMYDPCRCCHSARADNILTAAVGAQRWLSLT